MITNHKLLVDRDCPMCRAYGKAFVKFKLVDEKTIHYYQTVKDSIAKRIASLFECKVDLCFARLSV